MSEKKRHDVYLDPDLSTRAQKIRLERNYTTLNAFFAHAIRVFVEFWENGGTPSQESEPQPAENQD